MAATPDGVTPHQLCFSSAGQKNQSGSSTGGPEDANGER